MVRTAGSRSQSNQPFSCQTRNILFAEAAFRNLRRLSRACCDPISRADRAQPRSTVKRKAVIKKDEVFGCVYRKLDSAIVVMKAAEEGRRYDAACVLDGAMDRSVFVERPMSPQLINNRSRTSPNGIFGKDTGPGGRTPYSITSHSANQIFAEI
jgi:hypothetical protein